MSDDLVQLDSVTMVTTTRTATAFERLERLTDLPIAVLALLIVPALILEGSESIVIRRVATAVNWIV